MKRLKIILLFLVFGQIVGAQNDLRREYQDILYENEKSFFFRMHAEGFQIGGEKAKIVSYYKTKSNKLTFGIISHPREKLGSGMSSLSTFESRYKYSKINYFLQLRYTKSNTWYFSTPTNHKGIAFGIKYGYGISLGMIKPYYIHIESNNTETGEDFIKYSEETAEQFLDDKIIKGGANFFKGINESTFAPGLNASLAAVFDLGKETPLVKAFEVGIQGDAFTRSVKLMANEPADYFFVKYFVGVNLGIRN